MADIISLLIRAKDEASKTIDAVAKKAGKLDSEAVEIPVGIDAKQADRGIDGLLKKVDQLDSHPAQLLLTSNATSIEGDIADLVLKLDKLEDPHEIEITTSQLNKLSGDLDRVVAKIREVDARDIDVHASMTGDAAAGLDRVAAKAREVDGKKVKLDVDSEGLGKASELLDELPGKLGEIGGVVSKLGAGGPVVAGVAATAGLLFEAANSAADLALEAQTYATLTGASTEDASRLLTVLKQTGLEYGDIADITVQVNGALQQSPELAGRLGINLDDGKDAAARLLQVIGLNEDGLLSMADASTLFGEEGIRQMAAVKTQIEDITRAILGLPEGAVVTPEDVARAKELKNEMAAVSLQAQRLATEFGQKVIPYLTIALGLADNIEAAFGAVNFDLPDIGGVDMGSLAENLLPPLQVKQRVEQAIGIVQSMFGDEEIDISVDPGAFDQPIAKAGELSIAEQAVKDHVDALNQAYADAAESSTGFADVQQHIAEASQRVNDVLTEQADALNAQVDAATRAADSQLAVNDALVSFGAALVDPAAKVNDVRDAAISLSKASQQLAIDQAAASGATLTTTGKLDAQNQALLSTAAAASGPARDGILEYIGSVNQIPPEKLTEIQAAIAQGDLDRAKTLLDDASLPRTAAMIADADTAAAERDLNNAARNREVMITAKLDPRYGADLGALLRTGNRDTGGTVPPGEFGIVAEKRPEIINSRYLVTEPTLVPPGTRVTSGARTARILRTQGTRGLKKYDRGGIVTTAVPINVTVNTGVVGNTFDLMHTVNDAMRRAARLLPRG